jgi:hypothetical protein
MTVVALTWEDHKALMEALENRSPAVRQARVAHALLLMAKGLPASTVADYLFLPEATVTQYWQAFLLGQSAGRGANRLGSSTEDSGDERDDETRLRPPTSPGGSGRRRWVQDLHGSLAR